MFQVSIQDRKTMSILSDLLASPNKSLQFVIVSTLCILTNVVSTYDKNIVNFNLLLNCFNSVCLVFILDLFHI